MRIGFDAKRLYCNFTGLGNYSRAVLRDLGQFCPDYEYYLYTPAVSQNGETRYFLEDSTYRTQRYEGRLEWLWRSYAITNRLRADGISLYHGLSHELPINIHQSGIKSVVTIHDLIFEIFPQTYSFLDRSIYRLKFKRSCCIADRIVAISESTKRDIVERYGIDPQKIEVIYQSCHPLFYEPTPPSLDTSPVRRYNLPSEYLLYVGSITPRKNLGIVIEAYEQLSPEERIPWVIIGTGRKHQQELAKRIAEKQLDRWVIWISDLADNYQLKVLYEHAAALIYPSLYEGFGLPVVEGLLCKTPVITSNTSSLPEAGGPHSAYVNPNRADEIAHALRKVLGDANLRTTMKEEGYRYATEKFSRKRVTEELSSLYQRTLHDG